MIFWKDTEKEDAYIAKGNGLYPVSGRWLFLAGRSYGEVIDRWPGLDERRLYYMEEIGSYAIGSKKGPVEEAEKIGKEIWLSAWKQNMEILI